MSSTLEEAQSGSTLEQARSGRSKVLVGALVLVLAAFSFVSRPASYGCLAGAALLLLTAWWQRHRAAVQLGLFVTVFIGVALAGIPYSQLTYGVAGLVPIAATRWVGWLGAGDRWFVAGRFRRSDAALCLASVAVSGTALLGWFLLLKPDVSDLIGRFLPAWPPLLIVAAGLVFSMINAAVEELAYRGVVQHAVAQVSGSAAVAVIVQAMAFGAAHIHGFPRGWIGVGLATVYGLMMGLIRHRAGGLLAPWAGHVFTDLTIVSILVYLAR